MRVPARRNRKIQRSDRTPRLTAVRPLAASSAGPERGRHRPPAPTSRGARTSAVATSPVSSTAAEEAVSSTQAMERGGRATVPARVTSIIDTHWAEAGDLAPAVVPAQPKPYA